MADTGADTGAETGRNQDEYSVSELSAALKRTVEANFSHVRVRAEISGFKRAASGHLYMTLKDENAVLDAVCWRGVAGRLAFQPEDGLEVIASGKVTTYAGRSKYQLVIDAMEPAGVGALMALLEERRKKLAAEGLFDAAAKQPLPYLPQVIGVVTSPTGAVIRDILHRLRDRFPRRVIVWPVLVQGDKAAGEVAAAVAGFNRLEDGGTPPRPDVLIVARGGGSLEDLWAFNEEIVVRAVSESRIPVISAIGHETDTTLVDHVADRRAPTPSAAAEMAVPVKADLDYTVADLTRRLVTARSRFHESLRTRLAGLARGLPRPRDILGMAGQRLDELSLRLARAPKAAADVAGLRFERVAARFTPARLEARMEIGLRDVTGLVGRLDQSVAQRASDAGHRLQALARLFSSLDYHRVLDRGFAILRNEAGRPITSSIGITPGTGLDIELKDGHVMAQAKGGRPNSKARPKPKLKPKPKPKSPKARPKPKGKNQGELF